jgi:threonine aldolase
MIDLRSDTVTRPTPAMIEAMRQATWGDDSRDGDSTVVTLETLAAERTGKEAALFVPSGTMANLVAVLTHARRGGEVLLHAGAHILNSEMGGIAAVAGAFHRGLPGARGAMDLNALTEAIRPETRASFGTALVCLETSHNRAGGAVLPLAHIARVGELARGHRIPVHIDGARVFNAAAALSVDVREIVRHADTVAFCVSKGLSAPVGSLLCGPRAWVERARACRRMVGGNMRQAGPLAAAGIVALETMADRLVEDHGTARRLAEGLHALAPELVDPAEVETNLVKVHLPREGPPAADWSVELRERGVLVSPCESHALRFVTHRHIGAADIQRTVDEFTGLWRARFPRRERRMMVPPAFSTRA